LCVVLAQYCQYADLIFWILIYFMDFVLHAFIYHTS